MSTTTTKHRPRAALDNLPSCPSSVQTRHTSVPHRYTLGAQPPHDHPHPSLGMRDTPEDRRRQLFPVHHPTSAVEQGWKQRKESSQYMRDAHFVLGSDTDERDRLTTMYRQEHPGPRSGCRTKGGERARSSVYFNQQERQRWGKELSSETQDQFPSWGDDAVAASVADAATTAERRDANTATKYRLGYDPDDSWKTTQGGYGQGAQEAAQRPGLEKRNLSVDPRKSRVVLGHDDPEDSGDRGATPSRWRTMYREYGQRRGAGPPTGHRETSRRHQGHDVVLGYDDQKKDADPDVAMPGTTVYRAYYAPMRMTGTRNDNNDDNNDDETCPQE